jgi:predicted Zn-dependent peptidase
MKSIIYIHLFLSCLFIKAQETPTLETYTLKNGLKLYFIKYGKIEAMNIALIVNSGKKNEAPGQQGYNNLTSKLLLQGNSKYSEEAQNDRAFSIGTEMRANAGYDYTAIDMNVLSKDANTAFDLLSAAVTQPLFNKDKVSQYISYLIDYNNPAKMDIANMAHTYSNLGVFGIENPLGRSFYKKQLELVTSEKLKEFHQFNYTPKNTRITVCGNFKSEEIKKLIETYFGEWKSTFGEVNGVSLESPSIKKQEIAFANRVGAVQCALEWTKIAPGINDKDYLAFQIANQLFNQTLFREIREKGGKTYGIYSSLVNSRFSNVISVSCSVRSNEMLNTVNLFDQTLKDFATANFTKQEYDNEIATYRTTLLRLEYPEQVMEFYNPVLYNFEARKNALKELETLKMEDVQKVVKKYYTPGIYKLVISGDEGTIKDQLAKIKDLKKHSPADLEYKSQN